MSKEKLLKIIEAAVIVVLGVLVAIFGGGTVLDIYLAVVATVIGVAFLALSIVSLVNQKELPFGPLSVATICITFGVALFAKWLWHRISATWHLFALQKILPHGCSRSCYWCWCSNNCNLILNSRRIPNRILDYPRSINRSLWRFLPRICIA